MNSPRTKPLLSSLIVCTTLALACGDDGPSASPSEDAGARDATSDDDERDAGNVDDASAEEDASDAGGDAEADAPDAGVLDAGDAAEPDDSWATGCDAVYELRAHAPSGASPLSVSAGGFRRVDVVFDAPWGNTSAQAIAFRALTDNRDVLRDWRLSPAVGDAILMMRTSDDAPFAPYPADVGVDLPVGPQSLRLTLSYDSTAQTADALDRSGVAVCVVQGQHLRPKKAALTSSLYAARSTMAPANSYGNKVTRSCTVSTTAPVALLASLPYARAYAVGVQFVLTRADGSEIVLLEDSYYWQERRGVVPDEAVMVETGDQLTTTCSYDNPTNADVMGGEQTLEQEVCFNLAAYYPAGALSCL